MAGSLLPTYGLAVAITTSDATNFANTPCSAIYVGGAGTIVAVFDTGATATFTAVPVGTVLPVRAIRVNATGTTATLMLALY